MLPTVLLLLSVSIVRGSACEKLKRATLVNLQSSIKYEEKDGFRRVFPTNYYIQHGFNGSAQCEDSCCVISAAFLLENSWKQLLMHIELLHVKRNFIVELISELRSIWKESFQENSNPNILPSISSSPRHLLSDTSNVLAKWLALNCPVQINCTFPTPAPVVTTKQQPKEPISTGREPVREESEYAKEGEWGKWVLTAAVKNRDMGLSACPSSFLCIFCLLRMLLE